MFGPSEDTSDPLFLGHMLNDAAGHVLIPHKDSTDLPGTLMPAATRYCKVAKEANNCRLEEVHERLYLVVVRAQRAIKRGEELTVHYGPFYWLRHFRACLSNPLMLASVPKADVASLYESMEETNYLVGGGNTAGFL